MLRVKKLSAPVTAIAVICCVIAGAVFGTGAVTAQQPPVRHSAEPDVTSAPSNVDTEYAVSSTPEPSYAPPSNLPESADDNTNPVDKSMKMPAVPYTEPVSDNADISAETESGAEVGEDIGGDTVPAMRMPDGSADMPAPTAQGIVPDESEPAFSEPDNAEYDGGTIGVYTSGSVSRDDATSIEMGTRREDVYSALGVGNEPYSSLAREEYSLDDGGTAVLIFDENNQLTRGYIAEGE